MKSIDSNRFRVRSCFGPALLVFASTAHASVHVVDPANGPGADFVSLPLAIASSAPFDTLLLRSGSYPDVFVDGKSLNFVADTGATVTLGGTSPGTSVVKNLPANGLVTFQGIRFDNYPIYGGAGSFYTIAALRLENNAGQVWFEACTDGAASPTLEISNCPRVTLTRCVFDPNESHASALVVDHSTVAIFDSTIQGGVGQSGGTGPFGVGAKPAVSGGDAIVAQADASIILSGSTLRGGKGGNGYSSVYCSDPANGGNGIVLKSASPAPVFRHVGSTIEGGAQGLPPGCTGTAIPGQPIVIESGLAVEFAGTPPSMDVPTPLREGQSATLTISNGTPGSTALVLVGTTSAATFVPAFAGVLSVGTPFSIQLLGVLSGSPLQFSLVAPQLPAILDEFHVIAQIGGCSPGGDCVLGNPSQVILLDSSL